VEHDLPRLGVGHCSGAALLDPLADALQEAEAGLCVTDLREATVADLAERSSSWAKRLAIPERRPAWRLTATKPARGPLATLRHNRPLMLHKALDHWAARQPDAWFAAESGGRRMRYADAQAATRRLGRALQRARVRPGERVAVLARNRLEYALLYYATSHAGVALVPLNTRLAHDEWAFILADARPAVLFVDAPFVDGIDAIRGALADAVGRYVSLDHHTQRRPGWESVADWLVEDASTSTPADIAPDPDRDALQLYTSATTGRPKGAVLTHRAVCANIAQVGQAIDTPPGEWSLVVAPLFHAAVVPSTLAPLARGGSIYLQPEFQPAEVVRVMSQERIGFAVLVPAMLQACLTRVPELAEHPFEALRLIYYGSSPVAEPTLRAAIRAFGCGFMQSYGMTEASQAVTFLMPADHVLGLASRPDRLMSAGRAAADTEIGIVDAYDRPVPAGGTGEIVVRGPQLMRGYWNQPQATQATLRGGWLHTGDVGSLDADGYLTIRDRLKDMIVTGGENVYPRAIEDVLVMHPAVAEVAVVGVPDARWGETVKAVVVPRDGSMPTADELIAFCREHLGGFEVPRSVDFVDSLARNAAGKVLKRVLREPYWAGLERQVGGV
jgi:acyl-CoA synthetase (AMP-forming)/AMP-acid ligase II